jgi:UDP-glucose 4-epimerase
MEQRVVVTGGAGFIASHLVDALIARDVEVHVVDDLSSGTRDRVNPAATLHELDVADVSAVRELADRIGPIDTWYHFAAQVDVRVSVADPALDARVNVIGTIAVMEAAAQHGAPVVFASSGGAVYGEATPPTSEAAPARPLAPYGTAKYAGEEYLAQDARLRGAQHVVLRFANVYGPRQDPSGEGGVVAIFGGRALEGRPARVFGDGTQTRDFVYVGDVVDATLAAAAAAREGRDAQLRADGALPTYNVGTGRQTSVLELWDSMQRAVGQDLSIDFEPAKDGEIEHSALDAQHARTQLGIPIDTSIDEGVRLTLEWLGDRTPA